MMMRVLITGVTAWRAANLPHGRTGLHAVVIAGIHALDPNLDHELSFELSSFLKAWSGLGYQGLVVWV